MCVLRSAEDERLGTRWCTEPDAQSRMQACMWPFAISSIRPFYSFWGTLFSSAFRARDTETSVERSAFRSRDTETSFTPPLKGSAQGAQGVAQARIQARPQVGLEIRILECIPMYPTCIVSVSCVSCI